jgi:hypothetical protein
LVEIILATKEGPSGGKSSQKIAIEFNPLWTLTPKEEDERRLSVAQADKIYYDMGAITPEEIALQRFGERGWQPGYRIDRELREFVLKAETAKVKAGDLTPVQGALTPTSNETIMTVDEARALLKLAPDSDPKIGKMKVTEYKAHLEAKAAVTGDAEGKEETGQDVTPPDATTPPSGATGPAPKKPSPKVPSGGQAA